MTHDSVTAPLTGPTITAHEALERVACLLDEVFSNLSQAQGVVSVCAQAQAMGPEDMQAVQKLDGATQTVEALSFVVRELAAQPALKTAGHVAVKDLYAQAALGHVAHVLQTGGQEVQDKAGEVELF